MNNTAVNILHRLHLYDNVGDYGIMKCQKHTEFTTSCNLQKKAEGGGRGSERGEGPMTQKYVQQNSASETTQHLTIMNKTIK